eukprot:Clim_evm7s196 gene=Clim_evmTU7s196
MGQIHTVGPNESLVVSGGCCTGRTTRFVSGGWAFAAWCVTNVERLSLEVMTLHPRCEEVETAQGVALTVTAVAQVKFLTDPKLLQSAAEQFLGKTVTEIEDVANQTLEGHLRAILGTMGVEEVYQDREKFGSLVMEVAAPDVGKMGLEILSFNISDIFDNLNYLDSLGVKRIQEVKRDADIGVAESDRDAAIKEQEALREREFVQYDTSTNVAEANRNYQLKQSAYDEEVNTKKADADMAYDLQAARMNQRIRDEEIEVEVVQRRKAIEVEVQEILRKERELEANIRKPADAETVRIESLAEGNRNKEVTEATAAAEAIRLQGAARGEALKVVGEAEAERMRATAESYSRYGDAALTDMMLTVMPKLAAEIAAPLGRVDDVVVIGSGDGQSSKMAREVTNLVGTIPPAVQALTGVDILKALTTVNGRP